MCESSSKRWRDKALNITVFLMQPCPILLPTQINTFRDLVHISPSFSKLNLLNEYMKQTKITSVFELRVSKRTVYDKHHYLTTLKNMLLWNMVFEQSEVSVPEDQLFSPAPPF